MPYSGDTTLTEHYRITKEPNGKETEHVAANCDVGPRLDISEPIC